MIDRFVDALRERDDELLMLVMEAGIDPDARLDGKSAYGWACEFSRTDEILPELIESGHTDKRALKHLGRMIELDRPVAIKKLIEYGAYLDYPPSTHHSWRPPLFLAARDGKLSYVEQLLSAGANPDSGYHEETALLVALRNEYPDVALAVARAGANPNLTVAGGSIPIVLAAAKGYEAVIRVMIDNGAYLNSLATELIPDREALFSRATRVVQQPAKNIRGHDIPQGGKLTRGLTALTAAARYGHIDVILALLQGGADPDQPDQHDNTLWHWACNELELAESLINAGIQPPKLGVNENLLIAAKAGDVKPLLAAIAAEADLEASNPTGKTPLILAAENGRILAVRELLDAGANPNHQDTAGKTALYHAQSANHSNIIDLLLAAGATPVKPETELSEAQQSLVSQFIEAGLDEDSAVSLARGMQGPKPDGDARPPFFDGLNDEAVKEESEPIFKPVVPMSAEFREFFGDPLGDDTFLGFKCEPTDPRAGDTVYLEVRLGDLYSGAIDQVVVSYRSTVLVKRDWIADPGMGKEPWQEMEEETVNGSDHKGYSRYTVSFPYPSEKSAVQVRVYSVNHSIDYAVQLVPFINSA